MTKRTKTTTVSELRKALKNFPPDATVHLVVGWTGGYKNLKVQEGNNFTGHVFIKATEE